MLKSKYKHDYITLKKYGDIYKLTYQKSPIRQQRAEASGQTKKTKNNTLSRFDESYSRSKSTIKELALCNEWQYFFTGTLDQTKYDRYNLPKFTKDLGKYISNQRRIHGADIRYIMIPEQHKDGAWHIHGLVAGLPDKFVKENQNGYLEWHGYSEKFGYSSMAKIRDKIRTASYITKYISKAINATNREAGEKLFYASHGLKRAETIAIGAINTGLEDFWQFENDFVKICWLTEEEKNLIDFSFVE